jgi:CubicO group peptidase (beta-lactamase class C family)
MYTRLLFMLLCCSCLIQQRSVAQEGAAVKIGDLLDKYAAYDQFNGAVLVAQEGKVIFRKGYGYANFEWDIPNAPDTKFRLGSLTKQFTAMLILQLAEKGKLRLDGKISDYLPWYAKANGGRITVYQLLTHTSGIPNYTGLPDFFQRHSRNPSSPREFIPVFFELPLEFEPGTSYKYSNSGYFVLGAIIEEITGQPYARVLEDNILKPLGMNSTGYDLAGPLIKKRAAGYRKTVNGYVNANYLDMSLPYAAGAMYATVEDLYRWDQALYTGQLLKDSSKALFFRPFLKNYACGWLRSPFTLGNTKDTVSSIWHGGNINGFSTIIVRVPESKDLVVLLNNTGNADLEGITRNILGILYNKPYDMPEKKRAPLLAEDRPRQQDMSQDTAAYRSYVGKYELMPAVFITITVEDGRIYEQVTGQGRYEIFPQSPGKFFMKVVDARMSFVKNEQGNIEKLILHQGGRDLPARKVE